MDTAPITVELLLIPAALTLAYTPLVLSSIWFRAAPQWKLRLIRHLAGLKLLLIAAYLTAVSATPAEVLRALQAYPDARPSLLQIAVLCGVYSFGLFGLFFSDVPTLVFACASLRRHKQLSY